jgi:DegV family protein with EDD domain
MPAIAIVTDTDSSLPADVAARFGIRQVPIGVHFGQETLKAVVDIDDASLFARVDRENELPTTSAPSPGEFQQAYAAAFDAGADAIVCICVSSEVSGVYAAATSARKLMAERDISVIDSQSISMGEGIMVLEAAEAALQGVSKEEVIRRAIAAGERVRLYAALPTLKYLAMSGRVGRLAAGVADLLNVKPVLTLRDGKLDLLERVRTLRKAWSRVIELTAAALGGHAAERMYVLHVNALQEAQEFAMELRASVSCPDDIPIVELTPGLSVHSGSGMVGVVVLVPD